MKTRLPEVVIAVVIVYLACLVQVSSQSLQYVNKIALDRNRKIENLPYPVKSVYAHFVNKQAIWLQLWKPVSSLTEFTLVWQVLLQPRVGNGTAEVVELTNDQMIVIEDPTLRIGVVNNAIPGPVLETFMYGNGVVLSIPSTETSNLTRVNKTVDFDDLLLPYHIPVFLCNVTGCPEYYQEPPRIDTTPAPSTGYTSPPPLVRGDTGGGLIAARGSSQTFLITNDMIIGILAWNALLSLLVLGLLIALIIVCHDLEKLRRKERRGGSTLVEPRKLTNTRSVSRATGVMAYDNGWYMTDRPPSVNSVSDVTDDKAQLTKEKFDTMEPPGVLVDSLTY